MLYRYKVGIFAGVVATTTFLIAYITGPESIKTPEIRVLYISFSDYDTVKRLLDVDVPSYPSQSGDAQVLKVSDDGSVTIYMEEWDLIKAPAGESKFFQNNILLECTASFPVGWKYSGFGNPAATEKNVRIHGNVNDSNTFAYLSLLNLMPLAEKSTGTYSCSGATNLTSNVSSAIHLFVPGETTFVIDYDATLEAAGEDQIFVPCPVTNASANVSLYFKNQLISSDNSDNLSAFNPKLGFFLKPKFVEQQNDPWGQFYCRDENTMEKSGVITIQPKKGLIVNAVPKSKTVFISKPDRSSSLSTKVDRGSSLSSKSDEKLKFLCQAKEEITLKFLRVVMNPMVHYDYNMSSVFPFSAYTEVNPRHFRNQSKIFCRTLRNNDDLHSWKVLFSSLSLVTELMDFQYDNNREDFSCCSPSNKRAKLSVLNCNSFSECQIKGQCFLPGHKCDPEKLILLPERAGCVRYKLQNAENRDSKSVIKDHQDSEILLDSGLLQCSIDGKTSERIFFATKSSSVNATRLNIISDEVQVDVSASYFGLDISSLDAETYLQIKEISSTDHRSGKKRYICRGPKFFLAMGFLWQTVYTNNDIRFHFGRDRVKNEWIESQIELPIRTATHRKVSSTSALKRVYCAAPLWNSPGEWVNVKLEV